MRAHVQARVAVGRLGVAVGEPQRLPVGDEVAVVDLPIEAIRTATVNAARALGIADSVGTIGVGMSADIVAVDGDPLADIGALTRVRFVMLRGRVVELPPGVGRPGDGGERP